MRVLAIETSTVPGSVAVLIGSEPVHFRELPRELRTTQALIPEIQELLAKAGFGPRDLELVAVSQGPGSFTGLRVGITTAKTIAYATGTDVLGVDTLDVIAAQAESRNRPLWAIMDAHRQQLFCQRFHWADQRWDPESASQVLDTSSWLGLLAGDERVTGPGIDRVSDKLPVGVQAEAVERRVPRASTVGELAVAAYLQGRRGDVWKLIPRYGRQSAAEEKADKTG